MKKGKMVALVAACALSAGLMAGCANASNEFVVGERVATRIEHDGKTNELVDLVPASVIENNEMSIMLSPDGTGALYVAGTPEAAFTYRVDGNDIVGSVDGEDIDFKYSKTTDTLTWDASDVVGDEMTFVFTR